MQSTKDKLLEAALRRRVWDAVGPELKVLRKISDPKACKVTKEEMEEIVKLTPAQVQELLTSSDPNKIAKILKRPATKPEPKKTTKKKSPQRKAVALVKAAAPIESDRGDRLMEARRFAIEAKAAAERALGRYRNAPGPVGRLLDIINKLPAVPNGSASLREWHLFTLKLEAARPQIEALIKTIK
jgi:hypothetical protein